MARSRSASFSDDDLEILGSQMANLSTRAASDSQRSEQSSKTPLQPINSPNTEIVDLSHSPNLLYSKGPAMTAGHVFGQPTNMQSGLTKTQKSMFYQPKKRVEHHRGPTRLTGPSAPKYEDKKPDPMPVYNSATAPASGYSTMAPGAELGGASYADTTFYTDPTKASADLKALLEGGIDESEGGDQAGQDNSDGTLEGINVRLLPHQVEGVAWMKGRELGPVQKGRLPRGGILADDMGLGKTLQSISLIISNPKPASKEDKGWKKHLENVERCTLVVAPLALIRQWEAEIKEKVAKSHGLRVLVHHGPNRLKRSRDLAAYDVVITTYQILVSEHGHSSDAPDGVKAGCFGLHWYRVILDEAHSIKNRNAKATKACCALRSEFRWCLTGTPMQNNLDELQSLINFLRIPPYDNLAEWRAHIDKPMKNGKGHIAIRRLHSLLQCFMKRRTKDILKEEGALNPGGKKAVEAAKKEGKDVAPAPAFKITERKVVTLSAEFSAAERYFYDRLQERADKSLEKMMKGKVNYANALTLLLRLRQACNHPRLVEGKLEKDKDAMSTDTAQPKSADNDMDVLADALGGMGIQARRCDVCGNDLSTDEVVGGKDMCGACSEDLANLNGGDSGRKKSRKKKRKNKTKIKKVVKEEVRVEAKKKERRKPRGRNVVMDSDDEEEQGSWLVPEEQQGSLRLGKAGGEEDENAEGGGDWLGSEDSVHHSEEDEGGSRLDSFVVDVKEGDESDGSDDTDSFVSLDKILTQTVEEEVQSDDSAASDEGSETESETEDTGISDSEFDSDEDSLLSRPGRPRARTKNKGSIVMSSAKTREVIKILHKEVHEHKFIVFSQFTSMLNLIEPFFRREGFKFTRYDGSMKNEDREESLRRLRHDANTRILLCSLKCGALGLNLTAATRVIILEPFWNPVRRRSSTD